MVDSEDTATLDLFASTPTPPAAPPVPPAAHDTGDGVPIHHFAERAYLAYAMSVVTGRALPAVEDGQKPVQRRILYAMRELGNRSDAPHKKSARIVGDVIGKFHPHGDASVYEAAVRMAQDFTLRYPLIDGQGNFGSRDGDGAAAMRYTEVRLTPFAEEILLAELDQGTVDFVDNYDGTLREPERLPARLPMLLLNGASGIAVGMATEIPPHNLREVAEAARWVMLDPGASDETILDFIPGPDFPGGGHVISSPAEIRQAYQTGRGSLRVRARWTVEPLARGQWQAVVHELPPGTSAAKIMAEIEEISNPKVKAGKKSLEPAQVTLKNTALSLIDSVRDGSDAAHPVRLVIEPKSRNVTVDEMMAFLLANTSLEINVPVNLTAIGTNRAPAQKGVASVLREWAAFRLAAVERRLRHRLNEVARRIHILDGRLIAFLHIDEVIRVIRESDEPKADLMACFRLTEVQAEDILEIRLRQLARLEGIRLETERKSLAEEREKLEHLLGSETARRVLVAEEIAKDAAKYGDDRRTLIEAAEKVTSSKVEVVADEPVTVTVSRNGFLRARAGHGIDPATLTWKGGDGPLAVIETRTTHPLVLIDDTGRSYSLKVSDLPGGRGDGAPASSMLDLAGRLAAALSGPPETKVLVAADTGYGFIAEIADMVSRNKAGKAFVNLDGGRLLPPAVLAATDTEIAVQNDRGDLLILPREEVKRLGGGKGVVLMGLNDGVRMVSAQAARFPLKVESVNAKGKRMQRSLGAEDAEIYRGHRARKGRRV